MGSALGHCGNQIVVPAVTPAHCHPGHRAYVSLIPGGQLAFPWTPTSSPAPVGGLDAKMTERPRPWGGGAATVIHLCVHHPRPVGSSGHLEQTLF